MSFPSTKRMYRRVPAGYIGYCLTRYSFQTVIVSDISLNGLRIERPSNLSHNSIVTVQFWLPDGAGMIDIEQAVVRWRREQEYGLQIVALSNAADFRLARYVEQCVHPLIVPPAGQQGRTEMGGQ